MAHRWRYPWLAGAAYLVGGALLYFKYAGFYICFLGRIVCPGDYMQLDSYKLKSSIRGIGRSRMLVVALLGLLFLNPPLLEIFSLYPQTRLFGWPLLLVYLFSVWAVLILLVIWPVQHRRDGAKTADQPKRF